MCVWASACALPRCSAPPCSCLRLAWAISDLVAASLPQASTHTPAAHGVGCWCLSPGQMERPPRLQWPGTAHLRGAGRNSASGLAVRCSPAMHAAGTGAGCQAGPPQVGCNHGGAWAACPILHGDTSRSRLSSLEPARCSISCSCLCRSRQWPIACGGERRPTDVSLAATQGECEPTGD